MASPLSQRLLSSSHQLRPTRSIYTVTKQIGILPHFRKLAVANPDARHSTLISLHFSLFVLVEISYNFIRWNTRCWYTYNGLPIIMDDGNAYLDKYDTRLI